MKELEFLNQLQTILTEEEFDSSLIGATEDLPYDRLLVFLGVDEKERERMLEVTVLKQELMQGLDSSKSESLDFFRVQFLVKLPFEIKPEIVSQMTSLVCYLNRIIELPGFEVDEVNLEVLYRYVLMHSEEKFNKKLFLSIVGIILLLNELFSSTLEKVALGEKSFNDLLEEIVTIAQKY